MNRVINFHTVEKKEWFESAICLLKRKYQLITVQQLYNFYNGDKLYNNICHITIDDGDHTFYNNIYPILKKYNVPASLYISPQVVSEANNYWFQEISGWNEQHMKQLISDEFKIPFYSLSKFTAVSILKALPVQNINLILNSFRQKYNLKHTDYRNISLNQLKEIHGDGLVTIGAHTINHPILSNENTESSKSEIEMSIKGLSNMLNYKIDFFAYPNGIPNIDFSAREICILKKNDIKMAFSTEAKNMAVTDDIMSIPRIGISNQENIFFLKIKLQLGFCWNYLQKFKVKGEYKERRKLLRLFNHHFIRHTSNQTPLPE